MSSIETVITVVVIMAYSIGRQLAGEPLRAEAADRAARWRSHSSASSTSQPARFRADAHGHRPDRRGLRDQRGHRDMSGQADAARVPERLPVGPDAQSVLWWWAAKIASGLVLDGIGHALGANWRPSPLSCCSDSGSTGWHKERPWRPVASATGIPFAPEPTKRTRCGQGRAAVFGPGRPAREVVIHSDV